MHATAKSNGLRQLGNKASRDVNAKTSCWLWLQTLPRIWKQTHVPATAALSVPPRFFCFFAVPQVGGGLKMMFACPAACDKHQQGGLMNTSAFRDHVAQNPGCRPAGRVSSSILRCLCSDSCTPRYAGGFSAQSLPKHIKNEHGGLQGVLDTTERKEDGALAVGVLRASVCLS